MAKRYGYRPEGVPPRDQIYTNQIAEQRPALATRVDCGGEYEDRDPANTVRGVEPPEPMPAFFDENDEAEHSRHAVETFNNALRGQPFRGDRK